MILHKVEKYMQILAFILNKVMSIIIRHQTVSSNASSYDLYHTIYFKSKF